jgi:hypothetical protein
LTVVRAIWIGLLVLALNFVSRSAVHAEPARGRVLIVELPGTLALTPRLRAELATMGLDSVALRMEAAPELAALNELARAQQSEVALCVERADAMARVSIADRVTNKVLRRTITVPDASAGSDEVAGSIALGAVELLRASLLELDALAPGSVREAQGAWTEIASKPKPFALTLGAAVHGGPGGAPPLAMLDLGGSLPLAPRARVNLTGSLPMHPMRVADARGSATLWLGALALGVRLKPKGERRVQPEFEIGALGACLSADGAAATPYTGKRVRGITGGPNVGLGLRYALTRSLALRAGVSAAIFLSRFAVEFGDRTITHLGLPWLGAMLGVEIRP